MNPRDTGTGSVLEAMVVPALEKGGYKLEKQAVVGKRPGGHRHKVDVVAYKGRRRVLISLKWQQVSGTAEQKVPYEVICLMKAVKEDQAGQRAYVVLGGDGWSLKTFYLNGGLVRYFKYERYVTIISLDAFVALANKGQL